MVAAQARQFGDDTQGVAVVEVTLADGSSFTTRLARGGKRRQYGETLAWAPTGTHVTAKVLLGLWLQSAPHRHVLMNGKLRRVGVGRVYGSMGAQRGNAITADFSS